jgi:RES domain-containing protein
MQVWRVFDLDYPAWDGRGAQLYVGRWNTGEIEGADSAYPVVYTASSLSLAVLEQICHAGETGFPRNYGCASATVPDDSIQHVELGTLWPFDPDWQSALKGFGDSFLERLEALALKVPSAAVRVEWNLLLNPRHPDFARVQIGHPRPLPLDRRIAENLKSAP